MGLDDADEALRELEARADDRLARRQSLAQRRDELRAIGEQVAGYRELGLPLDEAGRFEYLQLLTGSVPSESLERLQDAVPLDSAVLPLPPRGGRRPLIALTTRRGRPGLERALQQAGFRDEPLPREPAGAAARAPAGDGGAGAAGSGGGRARDRGGTHAGSGGGAGHRGAPAPRGGAVLPAHHRDRVVDGVDAGVRRGRRDGAAARGHRRPVHHRREAAGRGARAGHPGAAATAPGAPAVRDAGGGLRPAHVPGARADAVRGPQLPADVRHDVRRRGARRGAGAGRIDRGQDRPPCGMAAGCRRSVEHRLRRGLRQLLRHHPAEGVRAVARSAGGQPRWPAADRGRARRRADQSRAAPEHHQPVPPSRHRRRPAGHVRRGRRPVLLGHPGAGRELLGYRGAWARPLGPVLVWRCR